jgi:hypothetical protein
MVTARHNSLPICASTHTQLTSFAVHQVRDGWEILALSDDEPYAPPYWRVDMIYQYGWRDAGRDRGAKW